jgi:(5-formylfuran-3-yl)methyl phosphate synthase
MDVHSRTMLQLDFTVDRPGLLVSVRNADEARIALAGGADVIDVKEPSRGSLGAADADAVAEVVSAVGGRTPVSVAAGELLEQENYHAELLGVSYVKIGLAGCRAVADWGAQWRAAIARWPQHVAPVAVVYADWRRSGAPPPDEVLAAAVEIRCPALLVDTWDKSAGGLFEHWLPNDVASFCQLARRRDLAVVLAGSLQSTDLAAAVRCGPNLVAVRGAVCDGGRGGTISSARVDAVRLAFERAVFANQCQRTVTPRRGEAASTPR